MVGEGSSPITPHGPLPIPATPHIAPQNGGCGEANIVIRGQHLFMGRKGVVGPICPTDVRQFEVLVRARPDDDLMISLMAHKKREHHPGDRRPDGRLCTPPRDVPVDRRQMGDADHALLAGTTVETTGHAW